MREFGPREGEEIRGVLTSLYTDIQRFNDVPRRDGELYETERGQYLTDPRGITVSNFGYVFAVYLNRLQGAPLEPERFTVGFRPDFSAITILNRGWKYAEHPDGLLYTSIAADSEGKIAHAIQVVRPNGYLDLEDPEDNKGFTQVFQCGFLYKNGELVKLGLQIGYESGERRQLIFTKRRVIDTEWFKIGKNRFPYPTTGDIIEALENIRENKRAITLERLPEFPNS